MIFGLDGFRDSKNIPYQSDISPTRSSKTRQYCVIKGKNVHFLFKIVVVFVLTIYLVMLNDFFFGDSQFYERFRCKGGFEYEAVRKKKVSWRIQSLSHDKSENQSCTQFCPDRLKMRSIAFGPVGLASFPGSGNTWFRQMLQQLTGIHTSSVFADRSLAPFFPGEGHPDICKIHDAELYSVIKTHFPAHQEPIKLNFKKVIALIRNPEESLISWYNIKDALDQKGGRNMHTSNARNLSAISFEIFLKNQSSVWIDFHKYYFGDSNGTEKSFHEPVLPIFYEDLLNNDQQDFERLFQQVLKFLSIPNARGHVFWECLFCDKEGHNRRDPGSGKYSLSRVYNEQKNKLLKNSLQKEYFFLKENFR